MPVATPTCNAGSGRWFQHHTAGSAASKHRQPAPGAELVQGAQPPPTRRHTRLWPHVVKHQLAVVLLVRRQLVLDLRAVDFFGGHGFTALYYIAVHCTRSDADWTIVGGHPVRRLLSICDAEGELPLAESLQRYRGWTA